ncbi:hypothetical protein TRVL_01914 [Trypanosoma vivax]|nr:hypothetical protein TRVL_01914 [Trypanosoma vivax]
MATSESLDDYLCALVSEIVKVMRGRVYRRDLDPCLTARQRAHLLALRSQALFGDAHSDAYKVKSEHRTNSKEGETLRLPGALWKQMNGEFPIQQKPCWYQFTERLHYAAWVGLRGTMSTQLAAETFCSEFFYLLKLYPVPSMIPVMEVALSTACAKVAMRRAANGSAIRRSIKGMTAARVGFHVNGCRADPAVIAFLWLCRAFSIPIEVNFEPIDTKSCLNNNFHFSVKSLSSNTVVAEPLAAFVLCVESFLPCCEHWVGVMPVGQLKDFGSSHAQQRSTWIEYMQCVLTELRLPLLLYIHGKQREMEVRGRDTLISKMPHEQKRHVELRNSLLKDLNGCKDFLHASLSRFESLAYPYNKARPSVAISVAELIVAAYAFVLCTDSRCGDLLPLAESVPSVTGGEVYQLQSQWAQRGSQYCNAQPNGAATLYSAQSNKVPSGVLERYQGATTQLTQERDSVPRASSVTIPQNGGEGSRKHGAAGTVCGSVAKLLGIEFSWRSTTPGSNVIAVEAVEGFIRRKCRSQRPRLGEILSHVWRMANEQCVGFPFIILDKNLWEFVTIPNANGIAPTALVDAQSKANSSLSSHAYWQKLRVALRSTGRSPERRTYCSSMSKL